MLMQSSNASEGIFSHVSNKFTVFNVAGTNSEALSAIPAPKIYPRYASDAPVGVLLSPIKGNVIAVVELHP